MTAGWPWSALDAAVARIDAVLAEPDPQLLDDARWLIAANPSLGQPMDPRRLARAAAAHPTDAIVATALAHHAYGGLVVAPPDPTPLARTYVAPPAETRPGFLGRLRRRLFGEPPQ